MDETQALRMIQDVLALAARLATEREVYRQLVITQPALQKDADEYFSSPAYAEKLEKYSSSRNRAVDALRRMNLEEFAESLGDFAGSLNQNQNPPANRKTMP